MPAATHYVQQLGAFCLLVVVQSFAILLFKLCQVSGRYTFSVPSSVCLTEVCKLVLAASFHYAYVTKERKPLFENVTPRIVLHYLGLALLYTLNNQLSFYALEVADPGTLSLGKSLAPYLCALALRIVGQSIHRLQWVCVVIQCCALAIVNYDVCKGAGVLPWRAYELIALSTTITATTSVWNQLVIKGFDVPINLQNSIMYAISVVIAAASYAHEVTRPGSRETKGFLEGYTALASLLVLFQAFHGIAVSLVYRYADAIVKNFANSAVMAILFIVSAYFFALPTNLNSWLGVAIVLTTTYCYMNIALKLPAVEAAASAAALPGASVAPAAAGEKETARLLEEGTTPKA